MSIRLIHGDCLEVLPKLPPNSIDAVITDPPYNLESITKRFGKEGAAPAKFGTDGAFARGSKGFMGFAWDTDIAMRPEVWEKVYAALKPGAYVVAFSGSRTFGRMQVAIECAGFITHPMIGWVFAQGMPHATRLKVDGTDNLRYGTQSLKPALEPIYVGQKQMEGTGTQNWEKWGTGCIDIDAMRVPSEGGKLRENEPSQTRRYTDHGNTNFVALPGPRGGGLEGRWPANLMHDGSDAVIELFPDSKGQQAAARNDGEAQGNNVYGALRHITNNPEPRGDSGSAARFFKACPYDDENDRPAFIYCAKAAKKEKAGSEHATIKPLTLMKDLCRGFCPPGGTILDPFAGSGTTGQAAKEEGFNAVLIEKEAAYIEDIKRRFSQSPKG